MRDALHDLSLSHILATVHEPRPGRDADFERAAHRSLKVIATRLRSHIPMAASKGISSNRQGNSKDVCWMGSLAGTRSGKLKAGRSFPTLVLDR